MSNSGDFGTQADEPPVTPPPVQVNTARVIEIGLGLWAVALAVVLAVPTLHEGERAWWVWVPVAGLVLGALGWIYVRRGRGNAAEA
ncbi:DUF2530 domain-containing protein [Demetria terragena]|uniref:DUF2530 domain-containing protein n=1 Tax=Demetria terragena TaxID=63959 RepID=UPI001FDF7153|nr:DUF2530 domain-containing protein [Demetria terragena]